MTLILDSLVKNAQSPVHIKSKLGRPRQAVLPRFQSRYRQNDNGCWEWTGSINGDGYGYLASGDQAIRVHRLSWEIHNGEIPEGLCVLHHCDNRKCVNPEHLFLGTKKDNAQDMIKKGRHKGRHKLTLEQVQEIIEKLKSGRWTLKELGRVYKVHHNTIWWIKKGGTWKNARQENK